MSHPADEDDPFEDIREKTDNPMRRLFEEYGWPNVRYFSIGFLGSVVARVLDLLPPLILGIAIDSIFRNDAAYDLPVFPQSAIPEGTLPQFWFSIGILAFAFFGGAAFHWIRNWGWNSFAQTIQHEVRTDTYDKMQRLNMDFFAEKQTGEMMSILSNDVNRLERFLNEGMNSLFRLSVMVLGIAAMMFWLNPRLALVALLPVPIIAGITWLFIDIIQPKYAKVRRTVGHLNSRLENNLGGIKVIKTFNTEGFESERVDDVSMEYYDANWDAIETRIKFFPALRVIAGIGFIITFVVGGLWVLGEAPLWITGGQETLRVGTFATFILYTQRFIWPMAQFGSIINMYQRARASSARMFGLMDTPSRIVEDPDADALEVTDGDVEYDDVSFGYGDETIIDDINFAVEGGNTLALVGPTGAGKSTVLRLLLRMYDVDEGSISIDDQDIRDVTIPSLRKKLGYVSQDTFMFYGTVSDNIEYGTFGADHEQVVEAAKAAEAHEFIMNLPEGYETEIGERGVKLSGGQRQRLSIARAILKDPEILILDEATSDVDTETEMLIQRSIDKLTEDRTTFAIAHRLSTIKDADQILVLEDGEIAERGSHQELIQDDGLYAHLWGVQAGEIDELPEEFIQRAQQRHAEANVDVDDD
jgi:ATP-binding cassette subfamily B protein